LTFGCGLFDFDWKLCFKVSFSEALKSFNKVVFFQIISASVMYFVVLKEFEDSMPPAPTAAPLS